jgi:hypothetical protein
MGLAAALKSYCEDFGRVTGIDCEALVEDEVDGAGPMQAIALFRITQEALNNIAKYAKARHVIVHLAREGEALALEVSDDGVGIAADAMRRPKSHGLLGMRERALLLGGSLRVGRGVNGIGTSVHACVPMAAPGTELPGMTEAASGGAPALPTLALGQAGDAGQTGETGQTDQSIEAGHSADWNLPGRPAAQAPQAAEGRAAPIMHVQRPSADGHTRF